MAGVCTRPTWLGVRLLEAAIVLYRRRLSGRGPLRRVACTFARCESCSAYGLRVVQRHARSLPHALRLILGRIRRCRRASVYRTQQALLWGEDYDHLERLDLEAAAVHEAPGTRHALLRAAIGLARYRAERRLLGVLTRRLHALPPTSQVPRLLLRDGRRLLDHLRQRWRRSLWVLMAILLPLAVLAVLRPGAWALGAAILAAGALVHTTWRYRSARGRFERQLRLARFALG